MLEGLELVDMALLAKGYTNIYLEGTPAGGLARALVRQPQLVLMDEPTTYLDAETKEDLMNRIYSLHQKLGITTVVVTHEDFPSQFYDRVLIIEDGRLCSTGKNL